MSIFERAMLVAILAVPVSGAMIVVVHQQLVPRLMLLLGLFVPLALAHKWAELCYRWGKDARHRWWILGPAVLAAAVLAADGARQDAIFVVFAAALVSWVVVVGLGPGLTAGALISLGYLLGMWLRHQPLVSGGSAGDIDALVSLLAAIYGAGRVAELPKVVIDDAKAAMVAWMSREMQRDGVDTVTPGFPGVADLSRDDARRWLAELHLTQKEREVACWAARGRTQAEIAKRLGLTQGQLCGWVQRIKEKLEIEGGYPALVAELRKRLSEPDDEHPASRTAD